MRRFAELDSSGVVLRVIVADSQEWCETVLGGTWVETFKDRSQRYNYASTGFTYDETRDAFIPPRPFASWMLNDETYIWEAPVPMPSETDVDGEPIPYTWDEAQGDWVQVVSE